MGKKKRWLSSYHSDNDYEDYLSAQGGFNDQTSDFDSVASPYAVKDETSLSQKENASRSSVQKSSRKLSVHELSQRVLQNFHIRNISGALYAYEAPLFVTVRFDRIAEMLRSVLTEQELTKLDIRDFRGAYDFLFTESKIKMESLPIHNGCVLFEDGFFDIVTSEELDVDYNVVCISQVRAKYRQKCTETPVFDEFLALCSDGSSEIKNLILAFLGYCLIPDQGGKCFFVLGTAPNSGKSVLAALLQKLVGDSAVSSISLNDLHNNFALAPLVGKVLNLSMDLNSDYLNGRAVSSIKMLTGGDMVMINEKYVPMFHYRNIAKFVFATNAPVLLKKPDDAFWERMIIIPFLYSVEKEKQDKDLLDKLWEERDGIVAKAIKAARKLIKNNFVFPTCHVSEAMKTAWAKSESLSIIQFVQSCCDLGVLGVKTYTYLLYAAYIRYCSQNDYEIASENLFSRILGNQFGLKRSRWSEDGNTAQRGFVGIRLIRMEEINNG